MSNWFTRQYDDIKGNLKYDVLRAIILFAGYGLYQRIRHFPLDVYLLALLLVLSIMIPFFWQKPQHRPPAAVLEPKSLQDRATSLAHELLEFLRDNGPRPYVFTDKSMSDEEILSRVGDDKALGAWINKMHHGYSAAFKDRVIKIAEELAAEGLKDDELNSWVSPQVQNDVGIRTIAQKLLLLRNKLEMRAYELSGTEGAGEGALSGHSATYVTLNAPDIMLHDVRHRDVVLFNQYHLLFTARFLNNTSRRGARARTVVARMTYYKEAPQQPLLLGQSFMCLPDPFVLDPLWKSTNGLWLPGKLGQVDFAPNAAHELALVVVAPEEQPTVYAVAYRGQENPDMEPIDFHSVHRDLPVLVDVELRALDIAARRFRFRVYMRNGELTCDQCPTPT